MNLLKSFLKFLGLLVVVAFLGWYIGFLSQVKEIGQLKKTPGGSQSDEISAPIRKFPELQDPREVDFKWSYLKRPYELKLTLYKSVYDFYRSGPKEYTYYQNLPANWEEEYYGMFVQQNPIDKTIPDLAAQIKNLAAKNRLTEDQTVELAVSFVQSITYDNERARKIEQNSQNEKPNYPYELLYLQKGVCSDKSFLSAVLLREIGYGTALFEYKDEKHIAVGIQCPIDKSTYNSGFCYTETTQQGHKVGIVPNVSVDTNTAIARRELGAFDSADTQSENIKKLGQAKIYQEKTGKIYNGIIETLKTEARIGTLEKEIASLKQELTPTKSQLDSESKDVDDMAAKMDQLRKSKDYTTYNSLVSKYNSQVTQYKKNAGAYNRKVNVYNQKVAEYNKLIKQFYE